LWWRRLKEARLLTGAIVDRTPSWCAIAVCVPDRTGIGGSGRLEPVLDMCAALVVEASVHGRCVTVTFHHSTSKF
jgi:hypothetical protein